MKFYKFQYKLNKNNKLQGMTYAIYNQVEEIFQLYKMGESGTIEQFIKNSEEQEKCFDENIQKRFQRFNKN